MKKEITIFSLVLIADQILKFWVKTHMLLGQEYHVIGNWFILHFTENNVSALITIVKFLIVFGIIILLFLCNKNKAPKAFSITLTIFLAGIIGNIIDITFYGLIFSDSYFQVASIFNEGYAGLFQGKPIDMLYFPLYASNELIIFREVINIATIASFAGIVAFVITSIIKHNEFLKIFIKVKSKTQSNNVIEEIRKLNNLKNQGVITEEEFNKHKTKILNL